MLLRLSPPFSAARCFSFTTPTFLSLPYHPAFQMYNFEDEIFLHTYRLPWLIWIQLFVLLLLILILSCSGFFSLDFLPAGSSPPTSISSAGVLQDARHCSQEEDQEEEEGTSSGTESNTGRDESSMKDLQHLLHPCYYFGLAKQAFLQCLGLGYSPPNRRERGRDE